MEHSREKFSCSLRPLRNSRKLPLDFRKRSSQYPQGRKRNTTEGPEPSQIDIPRPVIPPLGSQTFPLGARKIPGQQRKNKKKPKDRLGRCRFLPRVKTKRRRFSQELEGKRKNPQMDGRGGRPQSSRKVSSPSASPALGAMAGVRRMRVVQTLPVWA